MKLFKKYMNAGLMLFVFGVFLGLPVYSSAQNSSLEDLIENARLAGIEESNIFNLQVRAEARGISDEELMLILRPAVSMAEKNLPYEMIFEKAFEGISKNVPFERMKPVFSSIMENSERAAGYVDEWVARPEVGRMLQRSGERMDQNRFRNEMVMGGAKTLSQNFDGEAFSETLNSVAEDRIMNNVKPSSVLAAISIMSDLPSASQDPSQSARIVLSALEGGFGASDLQKLPGAMNMAQRRSQLPAQAVAEGFSKQLRGGLPASQILQNLFNGQIGGGPPGNTPPGLNKERGGRGQNGRQN